MIEDCGGIFGLVSPWPWIVGRLLHSPNIFGDFGYGWVFWQHGRKLRKACARMLLNVKLYRPNRFFSDGQFRQMTHFAVVDQVVELAFVFIGQLFSPDFKV